MKYLEAEKYKLYEIYRRMSDVYEEECFSEKKHSQKGALSLLQLKWQSMM